jgi:hypothetical protein
MDQVEGVASSLARDPAHDIRFVALRGPEPATLLRFHPRLTVLSGFSEQLVDWLSSTLAHGPGVAPDGFAVVGGTRVPLSNLPEWAYEPGRCPVVRAGALADDLQHLGQGSRDELGFELKALAESIDAARRRSEAMEQQVADLDEQINEAESRIAQLEATGAVPPRQVLARDRSEDAEELERLLAAVVEAERLPRAPHPAAEALARAFDALDDAARRHRPREEVEVELRKWELVTAEARARLAERRATAPRVSPADLAEATRLREALAAANDRKRAGRFRRSVEDSTELRAQLDALLARLGVRSVDDLMLMGSGLGSDDSDLAIREATNVVAAAERRCADLRAVLSERSIEQLRAEREELMEHTVQVLGRNPGSRPATALREFRVEPQAFVEAQAALLARLRAHGARVEGSIIETTRGLIDEWRAQRIERERGQAAFAEYEDELAEAQRTSRQGRTTRARLTREIETRRTEMQDLEFDRRRLERRMHDEDDNGGVSTITPGIVERVIANVLDADGLAESPLPIIVEDPFGPLDAKLRMHALAALARRAGQHQIVLVTPDASTVTWARNAGETVAIAWTARDALARVMRPTTDARPLTPSS